ncbi:MAG: divalent-cation tolerance protein CutA [Fibrobacteres bacterium]|nr:divalent-cation tolerance protein CutA [Fibrobacterota bacterium]
MSDCIILYVTAKDTIEAEKIGRTLVEEKLCSCANIIPGMHSIYNWKGNVEESEEAVLILKTRSSLNETVTGRIKTLHSYECPCVVALPIKAGNTDFIKWIIDETTEK